MISRIIRGCRLSALAVLCLLITSPPVCGQQTIRIAYTEFPPATYTDSKGKPAGNTLKLLIQLVENAGYQWTATSYPAKRTFELLLSGAVDCWIGQANPPGLEGHVLASEMIIATIELRAYSIGEPPPIEKLTDLAGKKVIVMKGMTYSGWITYMENPANHVQLIRVVSHLHALKMLKAGRAKYMLGYTSPVNVALAEVPVEGLQYKILYTLANHIIISKKTPNSAEVMRRLTNAYNQMGPH